MTVRAWIIRNNSARLACILQKKVAMSQFQDHQSRTGCVRCAWAEFRSEKGAVHRWSSYRIHRDTREILSDTSLETHDGISDIAQELSNIRDERTNLVAETRYISPAESVHRAFCIAALQQMIGLDSRRWLRTGRYTPVALTRHSPACERPRECVHACVRACSARFRGCPTARDLANTALHENVSLCFPVKSWFFRTRSLCPTSANEIYDISNCIVNLIKRLYASFSRRESRKMFDDFWSSSSLDKLSLFVISFL